MNIPPELEAFRIQIQNYPNGLTVNGRDSSYAELFQLNGPYCIICDRYDKEQGKIHASMTAPSFSTDVYSEASTDYIASRTMHQHGFFEIMYVIKGTVQQCIEGNIYTYHQGNFCLLNHYVRHLEYAVSSAEVLFLALSDEFFLQIIRNDIRIDEKGHITSNSNPIYDMMLAFSKKQKYQKQYYDFKSVGNADHIPSVLTGLFENILLETKNRRPGFIMMVQGLIARIFSYILDPAYYSFTRITLSGNMDEYLYYRIQDILQRTDGRISRQELSSLLNYSPDHLNCIAKKYTGMSLMKFGRTYTLRKAAHLLSKTDLSITKIMTELGFSNSNYFYRIFKEQFGVSPNEYRRGEKNHEKNFKQ